jgi:hypothetical protein
VSYNVDMKQLSVREVQRTLGSITNDDLPITITKYNRDCFLLTDLRHTTPTHDYPTKTPIRLKQQDIYMDIAEFFAKPVFDAARVYVTVNDEPAFVFEPYYPPTEPKEPVPLTEEERKEILKYNQEYLVKVGAVGGLRKCKVCGKKLSTHGSEKALQYSGATLHKIKIEEA